MASPGLLIFNKAVYKDLNGVIYSDGVGIGTTSSTYPIHIYASNNTNDELKPGMILLENMGTGEVGVAFKNQLFGSNQWVLGLDYESQNLSFSYSPSNVVSQAALFITPEGNVGIGTTIALSSLHFGSTDGIVLPGGNTLSRPDTNLKGTIRFNTDTEQFEGYGAGNSWGSLGGVKSTDQKTFITAELTPGNNDSNLRFYTGDILQMIVNPSGNVGIGTTLPQAKLHVEGTLVTSNFTVLNNFAYQGDDSTVRFHYQINPTRYTEVITDPVGKSNFDITVTGIYAVTPGNTEVYKNGFKLGYLNNSEKDYDVSYVHTEQNTLVDIELVDLATLSNVIDIYVWPQYLDPNAFLMPGYLIQNISSYWIRNNLALNSNIHYSAGNVGIGTTDPQTSLHINTTDGIILPAGTESQRPGDIPGTIRYNTTTTQFEGYTAAGWGSIGGGAVSRDQLTYISASNDGFLRFYTSNNLQAVIDPLGNLGIGTALPQTSLHINRTDGLILPVGTESERPGDIPGTIRYNTTTTQFEGYTAAGWGSIGGGAVSRDQLTYISASNDGFLRFYTSNNLQAVINPVGNLGIGTALPAYKLDVQGDAYIHTLRSSNFVVEADFRYLPDGNSTRMTYQINPTRYSERISVPVGKSNFTILVPGLYKVDPEDVDIFVNGQRLGYLNSNINDYTLTYTTVNDTTTQVEITTRENVSLSNNIDFTIWPSYISENAALAPGYVQQNYTLTYWTKYDSTCNIYYNLGNVGIGTTYAIEQVHVEGDMYVGVMKASNFVVYDDFRYVADGESVRMSYQVNPTRYTEKLSTSSSNFTILVDGLYAVYAEDVEIFVNGGKLGYVNSNVGDYTVTYTTVNNTTTQAEITLKSLVPAENNVDIIIYPRYIDGLGETKPGYVQQNYTLTYWTKYDSTCNIYYNLGNVGIGTTYAIEQVHVEGDMYVGIMKASNFVVYDDFRYIPDGNYARMTYQINPVRYNEKIAEVGGKSNFTFIVPGLYKVDPEDVDIFLNGTRLGYLNSNTNDFTVAYTTIDDNTNTQVFITLTQPANFDNTIDFSIWPSYISQDAATAPGYVQQNYTLTYWTKYDSTCNIYYNLGNVGIGTTYAVEQVHVEGDMFVRHMRASNMIVYDSFYYIDDNPDIRMTYQVNPTRYTEIISASTGKSNFDITVPGLFKVEQEDVDFYINGQRLGYLNSNVRDYSLVYTGINDNTNTLVSITTAQNVSQSNSVSIVVYPSYINPFAAKAPGYVIQNYDLTYWSRYNNTSNIYYNQGNIGIGTTAARELLHVEGDMYVNEIYASNVNVLANFFWGGESETTRRSFQVRPVSYTEKITDFAGKSNFTVTMDGLFAVNPEDVDVRINGSKLAYITSNVGDYTVVYNNTTSNTTAFVSIVDLIAYDSIVDITLWPSYLPSQTSYRPGYAVLNVENSTYFGRTVGVGATSTLYNSENGNVGIGTTIARARLEVNGAIVPSACNVFDLGTSNLRWRDLYLSGNTIDMDGVRISANASGLIVNDGQLVPPGTVIYLAGSNVPTGYLEARGQAVSRSVYNRLFGSISTIFGVGDGSSTFTLPDLRGEFIRGWDNGRGVDSGRAFGGAQSWAIQNITGSFKVQGVSGFLDGNTGAFRDGTTVNGPSLTINYSSTVDQYPSVFDASRVVQTATETRPRNISFLACIKT